MSPIKLSDLRDPAAKRRAVNDLLARIYAGAIPGLNGLHYTVLSAMAREHYNYTTDLLNVGIETLARKLKRGNATMKIAIDGLRAAGVLGWDEVPARRRNIRPQRRYYLIVEGKPKSVEDFMTEVTRRAFQTNGLQISKEDVAEIELNCRPRPTPKDEERLDQEAGYLCLALRRRRVKLPPGFDLRNEKFRAVAAVVAGRLKERDLAAANPWRYGTEWALRRQAVLGQEWRRKRFCDPNKLNPADFVGWYEREVIPPEFDIPIKTMSASMQSTTTSIPTVGASA